MINDNYAYYDRPGLVSIGAINRTINVKALIAFQTGSISNKLVVGWDRSEIGNKEVYYAYANNSPFTTKRFLFDPINASTYTVVKYPTLEEFGVVGGPAVIINNPWTKPVWQQGFYITDQASFLEDRLHLLVGTRWSDLRAQGQTEWTPQVGANYAIAKSLSVYGLYSESFRPNGRSSTIDPNAPYFPPENGVGKEIGVKLSLFEDKLTGTVALFQRRQAQCSAGRQWSGGARPQWRDVLTDGERSEGWRWISFGRPRKSSA